MNAACLMHDEEKSLDGLLRDKLDMAPQTIGYDPPTIEIGNERQDGHYHRGCPLCDEEALPERCPGFRLDWAR